MFFILTRGCGCKKSGCMNKRCKCKKAERMCIPGCSCRNCENCAKTGSTSTTDPANNPADGMIQGTQENVNTPSVQENQHGENDFTDSDSDSESDSDNEENQSADTDDSDTESDDSNSDCDDDLSKEDRERDEMDEFYDMISDDEGEY